MTVRISMAAELSRTLTDTTLKDGVNKHITFKGEKVETKDISYLGRKWTALCKSFGFGLSNTEIIDKLKKCAIRALDSDSSQEDKTALIKALKDFDKRINKKFYKRSDNNKSSFLVSIHSLEKVYIKKPNKKTTIDGFMSKLKTGNFLKKNGFKYLFSLVKKSV